uniref:phosphatidylinositol-3,4,5-trisphosphate 5-phosphatase n=1 Tax=Gopherus evgoodei TaxID=1825980 RepID=A0A8C4WKC2_9SAUR
MDQCWYHGNITRSKAEDLLSKVGKDGSFLVRASESISSAYALCVLFRNCVYTYRILPNKENKLIVQASEGVPVKYFDNLDELIEFYKKENMGLVWHLRYPVQREEEEAADEPEEDADPVPTPPILPPRPFLVALPASEMKEASPLNENSKVAEVSKLSLSETLLQRLQSQDTSSVSEEHLKLIQDYLRVHITSDFEMVQMGSSSLPQLKKLLTVLYIHMHEFLQVKTLLIEGPDSTHRRSLIPPVTFEVKVDSLGISQKIHLKVDVELGKLIIKKAKDGPEDKFYNHKKILQLIKSQKFPNKLVIVLETEREENAKREGFCQLLQQMKNKHSEQPEPDMITIFIGTWNMGAAPPPKKITSWFLSKGQGKTRDDPGPQGEKEWLEVLRQSLQEITSISFKMIAIHTLWNIRIVVLAKPEHENRISHICTDNVKTGIANTLGNKGAVGVSFMFNGTSLGFVNSHLTSGSEKKHRRNQNYMNILRFLTLGDKKLNLNYRVELPTSEAENIIQRIKQQQYPELLGFGPASHGEKGPKGVSAICSPLVADEFNLQSWCDRVLWKSYPMVHVVCQSYGCTSDIMTSDHSPGFATFEVGVPFGTKGVPPFLDSSTQSPRESFVKSHEGENEDGNEGELVVKFIEALPKLTPIISDPEYLLDQHILISIKSSDSDESYGEGCIALRIEATESLVPFHTVLTHHGERTGVFHGEIKLQTSQGKQREKLYGKSLVLGGLTPDYCDLIQKGLI